MQNTLIQYHFRRTNIFREAFLFELAAQNLELVSHMPVCPPAWTELNFHQCPNCPLDVSADPFCPLAANLVNIVNRMETLISYDEIRVDVITAERAISQVTTAQIGISSMLGLVIATCGCPHAAFFRPMARFHLPLASKEETIFRATSMYLLAQYFVKKAGRTADLELEGLTRIYDNMQIVNIAIVERLRAEAETVAADDAGTLGYALSHHSTMQIARHTTGSTPAVSSSRVSPKFSSAAHTLTATSASGRITRYVTASDADVRRK